MDRAELTQMLLKVDTKEHTRIPMKFNRAQQILHEISGPQNIVVKARQIGTSVYYASQYFLDILLYPPMKFAIISYDKDASARHLERIRTFYNNLPEAVQADFPIHHDSKYEMSFPAIGSAIWIGTAGSSTFGRGDTWHRVLATEYAQWAPLECENMRDGLIPSIPKDSGAITIESSPRGEGTDQHIMYMDAKEGKSSFTPVFIPWFYCDDYTLPPGHILALATSKHDFDYTDEEVILVRDYNLDRDQIRWRRHQIAALRSKEIFLQEFPEDDVSCFRSFASDIFDREELTRLLIGVVKPDRIDADGVQWWAGVQPLRTYILSADTSTGWGEDPSVGLLLDVTDYPVVTHIATLGGWFKERKDIAGYWRNDEFAAKLVRLATQANRCEIVVERNETGHSVLNSIINVIQYGRVYHSVDPMTGTVGKPGWLTNAPSKRIMIDEGMKVLGSSSIRTWDEELVKELRMYRRNEDGTFSAPPGRHDDRVMALLMGLVRATDTPRLTIRSGSNVQFFGASRGRMDVRRHGR